MVNKMCCFLEIKLVYGNEKVNHTFVLLNEKQNDKLTSKFNAGCFDFIMLSMLLKIKVDI